MMAKLQEQTAGPGVASGVSSFCGGVTDSGEEIGGRWWAMSSREVARRGCDERGRRWCGENERGAAPFIAADGGRGLAVMSMVETRLQGQGGTGDDAPGSATSQRGRRA
jgi:hypothetical protein